MTKAAMLFLMESEPRVAPTVWLYSSVSLAGREPLRRTRAKSLHSSWVKEPVMMGSPSMWVRSSGEE